MFGNDRCYNGGKRHCFEPRQSNTVTPPRADDIMKIRSCKINFILESDLKLIDALSTKSSKYEGDVCKWCGESRKGSM